MPLESNIETAAADKWFDELGVPSVKLVMVADSGWPDRLAVLPNGGIHWAEFKRPGEETQPRQDYIHQILTAFGHEVHVYESVDAAVEGIRRALGSGS